MGQAESILSSLKEYPVLIVPGGGIFAQRVREVSGRVDSKTSHFMAIMGMNIYGLYLEGIGKISATESMPSRLPAVFLPYRYMRENDPLPHTWEVTSDSIACYLGARLGASEVTLLKVEEGIRVEGRVMPRLSPSELEALNQDVVDPYLPQVVRKEEVRCRVGGWNSLHGLLKGRGGTLIEP